MKLANQIELDVARIDWDAPPKVWKSSYVPQVTFTHEENVRFWLDWLEEQRDNLLEVSDGGTLTTTYSITWE
jgi:hypothetical protein